MKKILAIKFILLFTLICLMLSSCQVKDDYKELDNEYLSSIGLAEFVFPEKEYVLTSDYVHVYSNCTYEDYRCYMDNVIDFVMDLQYVVYCTDPSYDEQRGPFWIFDKYLFVAETNEDYFVYEEKRFELFYEYNDELYLINSYFENESITVQVISTNQMHNVKYNIYES